MKNHLFNRFILALLRGKQHIHRQKNEQGLADLLEVIIDNIKKKAATTTVAATP